MSAARKTAEERAARLAAAAAGRGEEKPRAPRRGAVRTRPVRTTVDLEPELHRRLKRWTAAAAEELEVVDLPLSEVFRALIRRLDDDPKLTAAILDDLRDR